MKLDINIRLLFSVLFLILLTSTFYPTNSNALDPFTTLDSDNPQHVMLSVVEMQQAH